MALALREQEYKTELVDIYHAPDNLTYVVEDAGTWYFKKFRYSQRCHCAK